MSNAIRSLSRDARSIDAHGGVRSCGVCLSVLCLALSACSAPSGDDGGSGAAEEADGCNDVPLTPGPQEVVFSPDPPPEPEGGVLTDGIYDSTEVVVFTTDESIGVSAPLRTIRLRDGVAVEEGASLTEDGSLFRWNARGEASGTTVSREFTCPDHLRGTDLTNEFTARTDEILYFSSGAPSSSVVVITVYERRN